MPSPDDNASSADGDAIKVYLRIRPPGQVENDHTGQILEVRPPNAVVLKAKPDPKVYTFDHVADINTTQESVFAAVGKTTIESCVAGYNSTIFAYGQTGSGKTFTMLGPSEDGDNFTHELRGVIPRSFEYLFSLVNREREKQGDRFEFLCRVSFLEIYNEQVYDLLDQASTGLQLRENIKKGVFVDGLIEQVVNNPAEAYNVLSSGWINRRVASTSMNRESSRSHAVFTVSIESKEKKAGVSNIRVSQLHLVDLAGSERQRDTKTSGVRLKEAGSINRSLSALGNVITALVDIAHGKIRHVPYRDSKLSFLLRDALGGNAKTFIIANVHPGAKCFGETLSTLNFARRAKMIKNKAVVNEDTQGNISHLQAEIRRLREELAEAQVTKITGGPSLPSVAGGNNAPSAPPSEDGRQWKHRFLDAMCLREKGDNELKFIKEKMAQLEELAQKREKALQSSKMVVRFRDSTISRLENARKQGDQPDDKDKTIASLKEEIKVLQDQAAHNPTITKYAVENNSLRQEVKKLKALQTVQAKDYSKEQAATLEKLFRDLSAELEGGPQVGVTSPSATPSSSSDKLPVSTLEKHKAQIQTLQTQLDSTKQELSEHNELARKNRMELEAEVASYKKNCRELEKSLEGLKVKNKMERDAMNNLHVQTLKTITTPKKRGYHLRNRLVTFDGCTPIRNLARDSLGNSPPSLTSCPPSLTSSPHQDAGQTQSPHQAAGGTQTPLSEGENSSFEGIVDEDVPDHVFEQCNEALAQEVKQLQDKNSSLVQQLHEEEASSMKVKQSMSKLEHQVEHLNQLITSQQEEWSKKENEATNQLSELSARVTELTEKYNYAKSEAEDLKICLNSTDKQNMKEKQILEEATIQQNKYLSAVETKLLKIEMEVSNKKTYIDQLLEDRDTLQENCNTLQAENDFKVQCQEELEIIIKKDKEQMKELENEMKALVERLHNVVDKNAFLIRELSESTESTDHQKQELLTALETTNEVKTQYKLLQAQLDEKINAVGKLQETLDIANANIVGMEKRTVADKEAIGNLMTAIHDLRTKLSASESNMDNQNSVIYDLRCQGDLLRQRLEEKQANVDSLRAELVAKDEEMSRNESRHQMDQEMLQADLDDMIESNDDRMMEMQKNEQELQAMQEELKTKTQEIVEMAQKLAQKGVELEDTIRNYEHQLEEEKRNVSTVVVESETQSSELQYLQQTMDDKMREIEKFKENEARFSLFYDDYEAMRQEKSQEITNLKSELDTLKIDSETYETKCQALEYQVENLGEEFKEKETELKLRAQELESHVGILQGAFDNANRIREEALEQKSSVENEIIQLTAKLEIADENQEHLTEMFERTKALESSHFEEKENLKSQLGEVAEERTKHLKEIHNLNKKNAEIMAENAKLAGHQNLNQKIQMHLQIKQENNALRDELTKKKTECLNLKRELQHYKTPNKNHSRSSHMSSVSSMSSVDDLPSPLKENVEPNGASSSS